MALNKVYTRINWENYPSENTDIDEINLNKMDSAINSLDNRIISQDALKVDKSAINGNIADWTMDETTGVITITKYNGEKVIFDLNIEKIPVGFSMSDDGIITMTTEDGTQFTADIGSMIPVLTFEDSSTIAVSVTGTGKNKTYSFSIKTGSVTDAMLQPNYLADIRVESANASAYAQSANAKSVLAESYAIGGTGTREGEDTDNAKYYMEQAKLQTGGIPTKVSELENDAGYITKSVSDLTNYYDKTTVDEKIDAIPKTDLTNYLTKTGDGSNLTAAFEEATNLEELTTGEKLSSIFGKLKLAVKNLKSLIGLIGNTDISDIGDGTITGGLSDVNSKLQPRVLYIPISSQYVVTENTMPLVITGNVAVFSILTLKNIVNGDNIICPAGSVPVGLRPSGNKSFSTIANNSGALTRYIFTILKDGSVTVYNYGTYSEAENFSDTFSYIFKQ